VRHIVAVTCGGCASSFLASIKFICKDVRSDGDANIELSGGGGTNAVTHNDDGSSWWES
jgi:hypothetical protein